MAEAHRIDRAAAFEALMGFWEAAGLDVAEARALGAGAVSPAPRMAPVKAASAPTKLRPEMDATALATGAETLPALRAALMRYEGCGLKASARNLVFTDGVAGAPVLVVGEAPGREEDEAGLPFVGRSGQLLDRMLETIGLSRRRNVLIANCVFWRPPGNRAPTQSEIAACLPFIERLIALAQPKLLVLAGGVAAQALLRTDTGVMRLRGRRLSYQGVNAAVILHPAYLLRRPQDKRLAWADLLAIEDWLEALGVARVGLEGMTDAGDVGGRGGGDLGGNAG